MLVAGCCFCVRVGFMGGGVVVGFFCVCVVVFLFVCLFVVVFLGGGVCVCVFYYYKIFRTSI